MKNPRKYGRRMLGSRRRRVNAENGGGKEKGKRKKEK
jgi:hypothetical protein